ncbi:MAG: hypothetical protein QM648_03960 [Solirubrobacterales bacterium]
MSYRYSSDRSRPGAYHVWGKVKSGLWLFRNDEDRRHFEYLINRRLSAVAQTDSRGRPIVSLAGEVGMCARNLLSSHYHLILWQKVPGGIDRLMRSVLNAYTSYYHRKYGTQGSLFPGPFRSDQLVGKKRLMWCIAYVNANHKRERLSWKFSTHRVLLDGADAPSWIEASKTLKLFGGRPGYERYMERYLERLELDQRLRIDNPQF